jgi:D-hexose-6-phosphate mutarotase
MAKALPDLGDEDYKTMLCVDSGSIETPRVRLVNDFGLVLVSHCSRYERK